MMNMADMLLTKKEKEIYLTLLGWEKHEFRVAFKDGTSEWESCWRPDNLTVEYSNTTFISTDKAYDLAITNKQFNICREY